VLSSVNNSDEIENYFIRVVGRAEGPDVEVGGM
jgi:hypothetical protein